MQGDEGAVLGSGHFLNRLMLKSVTITQKTIVQPWDVQLDQWDKDDDANLAQTEAALHNWALESLSNFRLFETYRALRPEALKALGALYQNAYGLPLPSPPRPPRPL